ncbi:MAG: hypothetical protein ACO3VD_13315, partial [Pseudomonadales bacterium]
MEILADLEALEALPDRVLSLALRLRGPAPPMAPGQYVCVGAPREARLPLEPPILQEQLTAMPLGSLTFVFHGVDSPAREKTGIMQSSIG